MVDTKQVLVCERVYARRELYFAILMDRTAQGPVMIGSKMGGMNIEDVARTNPEAIVSEAVDIYKGVQPEQLDKMATAMGFQDHIKQAVGGL